MRKKYAISDLDLTIVNGNILYETTIGHIYFVNPDPYNFADAVSCTANVDGFTVLTRLFDWEKVNEFNDAFLECNRRKEIAIIEHKVYFLLLSPKTGLLSISGSEKLTNDLLDACEELEIKTLRITQFCMLLGKFPSDDFLGVLRAIKSRKHKVLRSIIFDVSHNYFNDFDKLCIKEGSVVVSEGLVG